MWGGCWRWDCSESWPGVFAPSVVRRNLKAVFDLSWRLTTSKRTWEQTVFWTGYSNQFLTWMELCSNIRHAVQPVTIKPALLKTSWMSTSCGEAQKRQAVEWQQPFVTEHMTRIQTQLQYGRTHAKLKSINCNNYTMYYSNTDRIIYSRSCSRWHHVLAAPPKTLHL